MPRHPPAALNSLTTKIFCYQLFGSHDWEPFIEPRLISYHAFSMQDRFYSSSAIAINANLNGMRYLRYKAYLGTTDPDFTPSLQSITIRFSSSCIPEGQAFANGLSNGTYTITINAAGYQIYSDPVLNISSPTQSYNAVISQ